MRLEAKHHVLKLADRPGLVVSQGLCGLLHSADHGRWTADQDLDILCRCREMLLNNNVSSVCSPSLLKDRTYLDHVSSHESNATLPSFWRVVEHVVHIELGVLIRELIDVLLEQNILLVHIGEDQVDLRLIALVPAPHNSTHNLQHGRNARPAGDHAKASHHVRRVDHRALGALDAHGVSDLESSEMPTDVARRVRLDQQVKVARRDI